VAVSTVVFGVVPLELWSRGVIRSYELAAPLSVAAGAVGAAASIVIVRGRMERPTGAGRDTNRKRPNDEGDQLRTSLVHPDL